MFRPATILLSSLHAGHLRSSKAQRTSWEPDEAVGEVMSIGKTYKEAFQKAIRSLERGRYGLGHAKDFDKKTKKELLAMLHVPSSERQFIMYEALRKALP